jgi:hypothetical protein
MNRSRGSFMQSRSQPEERKLDTPKNLALSARP